VQVALGFNRTQYSLPELVDLWSRKVKAIGLREYYGVEAWDWGLPGRARGGRVNYHRKWSQTQPQWRQCGDQCQLGSSGSRSVCRLSIALESSDRGRPIAG